MPLLSGPGWKASEARQHFKRSHGCSAAATPAPNGGGPLRTNDAAAEQQIMMTKDSFNGGFRGLNHQGGGGRGAGM